jgi:hypothetical protein
MLHMRLFVLISMLYLGKSASGLEALEDINPVVFSPGIPSNEAGMDVWRSQM